MAFISPQSWKFYTGTYLTEAAVDIAESRNLPFLRKITADACTAGPSFDPSKCAYYARILGRAETEVKLSGATGIPGAGQSRCWNGTYVQSGTQCPGYPSPAAAGTSPTSLAILAATGGGGSQSLTPAVVQGVQNTALAALNTSLNNRVCGRA